MDGYFLDFSNISHDSQAASKYIVDVLLNKIYPLIYRIRSKLQSDKGVNFEEYTTRIEDIFALCCSQIKKCILNLFDIFKYEHYQHILLQESRQCILERLSWCVNRLVTIEENLEKLSKETVPIDEENFDESILVTPMYFVNWIDHAFEILTKLANVIYKTDYKETEELCDQWKNEVVECVSGLHISLDELLLSAMTLCKYCLPTDQHIIKARCQVVLREARALLSELIVGDVSEAFSVKIDTLKLPVKPSNVNVLIDVLKDVLYVLETNTNTALLALLVHCFSFNISPVNTLKEHFNKKTTKGVCPCSTRDEHDITNNCLFVKEFDLYNERLLQIGSFAVSCSSDQNRILSLRSGLASLEALDPHLVPALMLSPHSHHAELLSDSWRQEVEEIKESVFLIVDPAAFSEKSKSMMHQKLLDILKEKIYSNTNVCSVINIGCVIYDFFNVYIKYEPDALIHYEKLIPLMVNLNKVQMECKVVSNCLSSGNDFVYDVNKVKDGKKVTMKQLLKRLKLLYTLVCRINHLLHPKESDHKLFELIAEEQPAIKNLTHTLSGKNDNSVRKPASDISRSIFARTTNLRSSQNNVFLSKLTKHLKVKQCKELSFSTQLDKMFNLSEVNVKHDNGNEPIIENKDMDEIRETSVLYNFSSRKNRCSLRKAVLNRHYKIPFDKEEDTRNIVDCGTVLEKESFIDEAMNLQISEILDRIHDMTNGMIATRLSCLNSTHTIIPVNQYLMNNKCGEKNEPSHSSRILNLNINNSKTVVSKRVWNIPINTSPMDIPMEESALLNNVSSDMQPSNVFTLERINDLDLVENKLNSLKLLHHETSF